MKANIAIAALIAIFFALAEYHESKPNAPFARCEDMWVPIKKIIDVKNIGPGQYRVRAKAELEERDITFSYGPANSEDKTGFILQKDGRIRMEVHRESKLKFATIGKLDNCSAPDTIFHGI